MTGESATSTSESSQGVVYRQYKVRLVTSRQLLHAKFPIPLLKNDS